MPCITWWVFVAVTVGQAGTACLLAYAAFRAMRERNEYGDMLDRINQRLLAAMQKPEGTG